MTNLEILRLAMNGLIARINHEEEINERTKREHGRDNNICMARLEKYNKQYDELRALILKEENAQ